jgi:Protein of unknown function (DUF4056)
MANAFLARWVRCGAVALASLPSAARADANAPSLHAPRERPCCALAPDMPVHLGSAHAPIVLGGVMSARGLGRHSYLPDGVLTENNGFLYTRRGGFVDVAHARDNADVAAYLARHLRPLLARGTGRIDLWPKGADRSVRVVRAVPNEELDRTSARIAVRVAFDLSIWTELLQYYGFTKIPGAEEVFSAFTPDDLYSNLLGAELGVAALDSPLPYDQAMDVALATALARLGAVPQAETRRVLQRLAGAWWKPEYSWPAREIAVARRFDLGPKLGPALAPADVIDPRGDPVVLDVPQTDEHGAPLSEYYALEVRVHPREMARFPREEEAKVLGEADIPRLVDDVHRALDEAAARGGGSNEQGVQGGVGHYVNGLRLFELSGAGGVHGSGDAPTGVGGGRLVMFRGDTRGGDFGLMQLDVMHTSARGLMGGVSFFRSEAMWLCHDPETNRVRAPLLSLLGPCAAGEWLGLSGALGEGLHDGATGRTALRPIRLGAVLNPLANGQSSSYDAIRLLFHVAGEVEHVWSEAGGGRTLPRAGPSLTFLARTPWRRLEARAAAGYRLDVAEPRDGVFESNLRFSYYFLLGGTPVAGAEERLDPWAIGALGVDGSYSYWARPENAYPEIAAPFVSTDHPGTWQLLVTATIGLESLTF